MNISVTITGLREALALLHSLDSARILTPIGVAVAEEARNRIAPYPAQTHAKQPFRSAKQRRYFFAALKKGEIEVPYRRGGKRSQTLGRRWVITPTGSGADLVNNASYAPLVQGGKTQVGFHRGNWPTDDGVATELENSGVVQKIAEQVLGQIIGGG